MRAKPLTSLFETTLFRDRARTAPYRTFAAELDAVRTRQKAMSVVAVTRDYIETSTEFVALSRQVLDRGLMLVLDPERPIAAPKHLQPVYAFILHHDQAWRIPAFRALRATAFEDGRWTNAAEDQMSLLLGYTARQRAVWMAQQRWRHAAWGYDTLYTLLGAKQRAVVAAHGKRCLGPASSIEGTTFFIHKHRHEMKRGAAKLAPKGFTVARVAIDYAVAEQLLGQPADRLKRRGTVISATVAKPVAPTVSAALRSNVEFLTTTGWR